MTAEIWNEWAMMGGRGLRIILGGFAGNVRRRRLGHRPELHPAWQPARGYPSLYPAGAVLAPVGGGTVRSTWSWSAILPRRRWAMGSVAAPAASTAAGSNATPLEALADGQVGGHLRIGRGQDHQRPVHLAAKGKEDAALASSARPLYSDLLDRSMVLFAHHLHGVRRRSPRSRPCPTPSRAPWPAPCAAASSCAPLMPRALEDAAAGGPGW